MNHLSISENRFHRYTANSLTIVLIFLVNTGVVLAVRQGFLFDGLWDWAYDIALEIEPQMIHSEIALAIVNMVVSFMSGLVGGFCLHTKNSIFRILTVLAVIILVPYWIQVFGLPFFDLEESLLFLFLTVSTIASVFVGGLVASRVLTQGDTELI